MKISDVKTNLILELYEKHNKEIVHLSGFVGSKANNLVKLYPELESRTHYEIPEAAILHVEQCCSDCGDDGKVNVYMTHDTEIKLVQPMKADPFYPGWNPPHIPKAPRSFRWPFNSITDLKFPTWPPFPPFDDILDQPCVKKCMQMVRDTPGYLRSVDGPGVFQIVVTPAGRIALEKCLCQCGYCGNAVFQIVLNALQMTVTPPNP